jgi:hypothetical protein
MRKLFRKKLSKKIINKRKRHNTKRKKRSANRVTKKPNNTTRNKRGSGEKDIMSFIKKEDIPTVVSKQPICQFCNQSFKIPSKSDTGVGDDAIYKTSCGHIFHVNCLEHQCRKMLNQNKGNTTITDFIHPKCPVCGSNISHDCISVEAFKEKYLDTDDLDTYLMNIYESQQSET